MSLIDVKRPLILHRLESYMGIMDHAANLLVEEIGWHAKGFNSYFQIEDKIQAMTMSVIGQTGFG